MQDEGGSKDFNASVILDSGPGQIFFRSRTCARMEAHDKRTSYHIQPQSLVGKYSIFEAVEEIFQP